MSFAGLLGQVSLSQKIAGDFPIWLKAIICLMNGVTVLYAVGAFGYYNFLRREVSTFWNHLPYA